MKPTPPKKTPAKKKVIELLAEEKKTLSQYHNLLLQTPVPIAIFRGNNYLVELVNDSALGVLVKDKSIIGKPLFEAMPELENPIKEIFDKVMQSGIPFSANEMEVKLFRKSQNETAWFNVNYQPIREDDNTISGILAVSNEVTDQVIARKKIEDSEKRYNMMLMKSPFGFAILKGKNMVIDLANDSIKAFWGKGKDVEGKPLFDLLVELKDSTFPSLLENVYNTGVPFYGDELLAPILRNEKREDVYFNFVYQPYLEVDESISGVTIIAYEVTTQALVKKAIAEQREVEQRTLKLIEESNTRYHTMLMQSPFAFSIMKGKDMVITLANDLIKDFWGKGTDVEGKTLLQVLPELKDQPFPEMINQVFMTGKPVYANEILARLLHKDKLEDKYFNIVYQPHYEADNTISGVTTIAYEVTEMVLARRKIEDSDKRYNMMLMKSPFAFAILKGKDMVLAMANDSIKEMWGKGNEIEGKPLIEVLPELKGQGFMELLDGVYTTGIPYIANEALAKVKRNGKMEDVYFNFVYQPYRETNDTISGVTIIAIEVTNEVIAKQKIKDSQQQLQNIFMQAPFALNIYEGKELVISLANKLFCEIIGKTESEILGKKLFDAFPETATQGLDKILSDIFSTGIPFKGNEFPVYFLKNGNEFKGYFDFIYQPIFDYNKNVSGVINVAIDVTDKVLARKKIEESEEHFRLMADLMPSKISNANVAGDVTYFNKHWLDFSGYTFEELRDFGYHKIMHPDEMEEFQQRFQKAAETGTDLVMEMRFKNKQGDYVWHLNIASPIKDKNGIHKMWIGVTTEIHEQKTVAEKIKASEERFRQLIQQAPVAICVILGERYVVQTVNAGMLEFWGRTKAQVLNKPIFEVLTELEGQGFEALVNGVYTTGQRFVGTELPVTLLRKGQLENAYVTFIYEPLREVDGTISGIMVLAHEITDQVNARKAIEVSEKKFRLLTNAMPQKISNADADGNVIFYNQRWLDDTGLTFEELKDWGWRKVMHPDEIENIVENWKYSVSTGDIFDIEMRIKNKAGEYRWNLSRAVPIRDEAGKILMWVGSNTDIHEQKEQKEALEQAVAERTLELSEANEELKKMNKELEAFAYVSSHDLQEPLRKIQTFAGRILEKENQNLSDSGKNYFRLMQNAAERMQTLIQDLLAFSHLSMADRKFETTDLNIIVEEVKKEFKDDIAEKNAVIEVEEICEVKIIPFQFRQLMHNLISNALKFSNQKTQPNIKISSVIITYSKINVANLPPRKEYCRIRISDNGIGFEKEFAEKIFEVFQKLHSKDEYPGTGIGLAIVKKIVDNHNGVITATSELNKGTTFDIYIPV